MNHTNERRSRRRRVAVLAAVAVAVLSLAVLAAGLVGNDFRLDQRRLAIPVAGGTLDAVLATPTGAPARGLVVVVHGDGPVEATHDGLYLPWFEAAADAGFATLSWSKPGVGGSTGHWLAQSMDDRAAEVSAAIDWAERQPDVPTDTVVLWGASQAGWVLPKVAASRDDVDAVVAASPAINWLRQGRFNLLAELDHDHADAGSRADAIRRSDDTRRLLEEGADYEDYQATTHDPDPMTSDRWAFVARNVRADATADLKAMRAKDVPVLLMLGEHDRNVDAGETAATYRDLLGSSLTTAWFDAAHSMARPSVEEHATLGITVAVLWPRALLAAGVLSTYEGFLRGVK